MRIVSKEQWFPASIILLICGLIFSGISIYAYSAEVLLFPAIIAGATCIFSLIVLLTPANPANNQQSPPKKQMLTLKHIVQVFSFLPVFLCFGGLWGPTIYLIGLSKYRGVSWWLAISLGIFVFGFTYLVFGKLLGTPFVPPFFS